MGRDTRATRASRHMLVSHHTSHITRHTSHVTRHTSHGTRRTSHVTFYLVLMVLNDGLQLFVSLRLILRIDPGLKPTKLTIKKLHSTVRDDAKASSVLLRVHDLGSELSNENCIDGEVIKGHVAKNW